MPVLVVIPARLGSTRIPHKPLQLLAGEPLIVRVARHVKEMEAADRVVVATDAEEVAKALSRVDVEVVFTRPDHVSGTDRVAEVAAGRDFQHYDIVVNLQGDEPFMPRAAVSGAIERVHAGDDVGTAAAPLDPGEADDPARVKVVCDVQGRALYFSRARIPHWRDGSEAPPRTWWQHLGIYAFHRAALERWTELEPTALETAERLEQLRALQNGFTIGVALLDEPAPAGIDTPDDLRRAERHWRATQGATT
ncbi:MAG TPA: 3-deoxy-manno-octulosonate cytidylyltransferase [Gemmatimonadales bacterium]|nr:3-deoxy-manno-octulosonate cytidylyltransferase [Gemmatimonadales bacterium]